jgi:predicted Zn-dependent peptidase
MVLASLLSGVSRWAVLGVVLAGAAVPRPAGAFEFAVSDFTLPNGLRLLVHEDRAVPVVSSYLFYRSGSGNEQVGQTGIAHLFEHMMFNGSKKYGAGTFDDLIEGAGGSTNGYTTRDFTVYLNDFPPESLDLVLALEADRMASLLITPANLEQERGIVKEERRLRVDNSPSATMDEQLFLQAFTASPYRWSVIGFMADLDAITLEEARDYFARYYAPNNATLVLAGDLDATAAHRAVTRAFGRIRAGEQPPRVSNHEPAQLGARRATVHKEAELPAILIGYRAPAAVAADRPALDVLDAVLSTGESSRLHRRLVYEEELATTVYSHYGWLRHPGLFVVYAQARPGTSIADVEREILDVLASVGREPPDERELRKAKNILLTDYVRGMKTVGGKANRLGYYNEIFGDYRALFRVDAQWEDVTVDDVVRVANEYLTSRHGTTIVLEPEARQ